MNQLEVMLVAHLALDRTCLDGRRSPTLSPACEALVDLMLTENVHRRLLVGVLTVLRVTRHLSYCHWKDTVSPEARYEHLLQCEKGRKRARYRDVVRMAQRAELLTVDELSLLPRETILASLGGVPRAKSVKADRLLELAEDSAA